MWEVDISTGFFDNCGAKRLNFIVFHTNLVRGALGVSILTVTLP